MNYFDLNRDGVNSRLLDPALTAEERDYIKSRITSYGTNRRLVRVEDDQRVRKLLRVPADIEVKAAR